MVFALKPLAAEVEALKAENERIHKTAREFAADTDATIARLKARVEELVAEAEDTARDAYAEGQRDAKGAANDLWQWAMKWLSSIGHAPVSGEGDGTFTAEDVAESIREAFADVKAVGELRQATIARLESEQAELVSLVQRYRTETPVGHQPHMIAGEVDALLSRLTGGAA